MHPCIILLSPNRCTVPLNIFISRLYVFWASMCPSSGENYCIRHWYFVTLSGVWSAGWISLKPADQTPLSVTKYQCRIDTVILSWWWAHGCPKHVEKRNKYIKQNCAPTSFLMLTRNGKGKSVPLQAWSGPEGSRKLRFPDFMTTAQESGKVVSLTHRLHLPPGNRPGTHFC